MQIPTHFKITAKPSSLPNLCEFITTETLCAHRVSFLPNQINDNPPAIVTRLYAINGIEKITVHQNTITVLKATKATWLSLGKTIGDTLRACMQNELPLIKTPVPTETDSVATLEDIQVVLNNTINPQIAAHQGFIKAHRLQGTTLYVLMQGGCQGCSQSNATLTQGVQQIIQRKFPHITRIQDVTEHAQGTQPYYS